MVKFTNKHNIPDEFYRYKRFKPYSKGDADFSVTGLIRPPLQLILEELHDDEIEIDVVDQMWALYGTAIHEVLATGSGMQDISEEELYIEVEGKKVKGAIDLQSLSSKGVTIRDFKVTTVFGYQKMVDEIGKMHEKPEDEHDWTKQTNMYAHMVRVNKAAPVLAVEIYVVLRDWSKMRAQGDKTNRYPQAPIQRLTPPLWPAADAAQFIHDRVMLHTKTWAYYEEHRDLPARCSKKERWQQPKVFAVIKEGGTRALKQYDNLTDAEGRAEEMSAKGKGEYVVDIRGGEDVKCLNFCNAAPFCYHGKKLLGLE